MNNIENQDTQERRKNCLKALHEYQQAIAKDQASTLTQHCSRLYVNENFNVALDEIDSLLQQNNVLLAAGKIQEMLSQYRLATARTGLSFFENTDTIENKLWLSLAKQIAPILGTSSISLLCPYLAQESFHDAYPDLSLISVEKLFAQYIESEHQGYVAPVHLLAHKDLSQGDFFKPSLNYYYDYQRPCSQGVDTTHLTTKDLEKMLGHSHNTQTLKQLAQEYELLQEQTPSLLLNLKVLISRMTFGSVGEQGEEYDTASRTYDALIRFFEYYEALSYSEKDAVPSDVSKELNLLHRYSSNAQSNASAQGEQNVGTCTSTRRKELEKVVFMQDNYKKLQSIACDKKQHIAELECLEKEFIVEQKQIASPDYQGDQSFSNLLSIIKSQQWSYKKVFPTVMFLRGLCELTPSDIKGIVGSQGLFPQEIRHALGADQPGQLDGKIYHFISDSMRTEQKVALLEGLSDIVAPALQKAHIFEYFFTIVGGDIVKKGLGPQLGEALHIIKDSLLEPVSPSYHSVKAWNNYRQAITSVNKSLLPSSYLEFLQAPTQKWFDFILSDRNKIFERLLQLIDLPLSKETLQSVILAASTQSDFIKQIECFNDIVDFCQKAEMSHDQKKIFLTNIFKKTDPLHYSFYLLLCPQAYEVIFQETDLLQLLTINARSLPGQKVWAEWLSQDAEQDYPMCRSLAYSLKSFIDIKKLAPDDLKNAVLKYSVSDHWPQPGKFQDLPITFDEFCDLLQYQAVQKNLFAQKPAQSLKQLQQWSQESSSRWALFLKSPQAAQMLTYVSSLKELEESLSQLNPDQAHALVRSLAEKQMPFLKKIAITKLQQEQVAQWLRDSNLSGRLGLSFMSIIKVQFFGPGYEQQWAEHMAQQEKYHVEILTCDNDTSSLSTISPDSLETIHLSTSIFKERLEKKEESEHHRDGSGKH